MTIKNSLLVSLIMACCVATQSTAMANNTYKSGYYVGLKMSDSILYGKRNENFRYPGFSSMSLTDHLAIHDNRINLGIHGGYLHRFKNKNWFMSIESYFSYAPVNQKKHSDVDSMGGAPLNPPITIYLNWERLFVGGLDTKIGYVFGGCNTIYGIIGVQGGLFRYSVDPGTMSNNVKAKKPILLGVTYGIGVERELESYPIRLGIDLKNTHYQRSSITLQSEGSLVPDFYTIKQRTDVLSIDVKVSYVF